MHEEKEDLLIVDADETTRKHLGDQAVCSGCRVRSAATISMARQHFAERLPTVLALDMALPGASALLGEIKTGFPDLPIVALADRDTMASVQEAYKYQIDDFLDKPVNPLQRDLVFHRTLRHAGLLRRLKSNPQHTRTTDLKGRAESRFSGRFEAVRQAVDQMGTIVANIAADAQGGMRYFDEMPYFVAIHDRDGRVLTTNRSYQKHLGDRVGSPCWEIYAGNRASAKASPWGQTVKTGTAEVTHAVVRYASGGKVPVIVYTAPICSDPGKIELVLEIFAGTKDIDRMANDLHTTQQRYRRLFDAVPNYVAVLDRKMRLTAFNGRFLEDFGFKTGRKFYDILRPLGSFATRGPISQTLDDGMPHQGEMRLLSSLGDQFNFMAWTSPIKTPAGKLTQVLVIFTDITELRRLQGNLSQLGLMISTVTHSLKGSLTGLDAGLYMIDKGFYRDRPGRIEEGLDVAKLMTERIRKLVVDVLYYAKERDLETEEVDAGQFAEDVALTTQMRVRGANIAFEFQADPEAGRIEIDPGLVRTGLINILENAIEACIEDDAGKSLRIRFSVESRNDSVQFCIEDNGIGMDEDHVQNMFKLFWSSKGKKGTGLGLYITNKAIQKHGGRIAVSSEKGKYTIFRIRLPRKIATPEN